MLRLDVILLLLCLVLIVRLTATAIRSEHRLRARNESDLSERSGEVTLIHEPDFSSSVIASPSSAVTSLFSLRSNLKDDNHRRLESFSNDIINNNNNNIQHVFVYHFKIVPKWGLSIDGIVEGCENDKVICHWSHADSLKALNHRQASDYDELLKTDQHYQHQHHLHDRVASASVYNFHSWWEKARDHYPHVCSLKTNLTLVESEEARQRYGEMFDPTFKNFDGTSTTHPTSSVQRGKIVLLIL